MSTVKQFYILASDFDTICRVSPSIKLTFMDFFFMEHIQNKKARMDYFLCRLQFYCLNNRNKRRFVSLIHSCHVMAVEMYKDSRFEEYLCFDSLMLHLIRLL